MRELDKARAYAEKSGHGLLDDLVLSEAKEV
jgi:hypothetical protein